MRHRIGAQQTKCPICGSERNETEPRCLNMGCPARAFSRDSDPGDEDVTPGADAWIGGPVPEPVMGDTLRGNVANALNMVWNLQDTVVAGIENDLAAIERRLAAALEQIDAAGKHDCEQWKWDGMGCANCNLAVQEWLDRVASSELDAIRIQEAHADLARDELNYRQALTRERAMAFRRGIERCVTTLLALRHGLEVRHEL